MAGPVRVPIENALGDSAFALGLIHCPWAPGLAQRIRFIMFSGPEGCDSAQGEAAGRVTADQVCLCLKRFD